VFPLLPEEGWHAQRDGVVGACRGRGRAQRGGVVGARLRNAELGRGELWDPAVSERTKSRNTEAGRLVARRPTVAGAALRAASLEGRGAGHGGLRRGRPDITDVDAAAPMAGVGGYRAGLARIAARGGVYRVAAEVLSREDIGRAEQGDGDGETDQIGLNGNLL